MNLMGDAAYVPANELSTVGLGVARDILGTVTKEKHNQNEECCF